MNTGPGYRGLSWVLFIKHIWRFITKGDPKPLFRYYARRTAIRTLMRAMRKAGL